MRAAGIKTLRTFIWSMHDASGQSWGVVSSAGGGLGATETKNLINLVSDAPRLGFVRLNVASSPQWMNDPIGYPARRTITTRREIRTANVTSGQTR
jgi:hypothetical protein